jgi:hypothetical protein
VDAVQRWARAGRTYRALRHQYGKQWQLSPSHFDAVGKLVEDEEEHFTLNDAFETLMDAVTNEWSVEELRRNLPGGGKRSFAERVKAAPAYLRRHFVNTETLGFSAKHVKSIRAAAENLAEICEEAVKE